MGSPGISRVNASNAGTAPVGADVAIEFSQPEHALANMRICLEHGVPVVAGTTGWYDHLNDVKNLVATTKDLCSGPVISASVSTSSFV
ncbi:MAG: hypothetical protein IPJ10_13845 [Flavobacteriales bacterium]|nr:hypothetical protein [Flavobacteriales bacterium]